MKSKPTPFEVATIALLLQLGDAVRDENPTLPEERYIDQAITLLGFTKEKLEE